MKRHVLIAMSTVFAVSCTHVTQTSRPPSPIVTARTASQLKERSFDDAGLRQFIEAALHRGVSWPPKQLDFEILTLTALYFSPELAVARAQVEYTQAGIKTAEMRPNPVLDFSSGVPSPYLIGLGLAIPVITGGKRGYAIELARDVYADAELQLAEVAWSVRGRVRLALLNALAAERNAALAQAAQQLQESKLKRTAVQLQVGEIARPVWQAARTGLLDAEMATRVAETQIGPSRAALATTIGLPVEALAAQKLVWPDFERLPSLSAVTDTQIRRDAIVNRLDVRRALAQYQVAERKLQIEIARRHPNFNIGPGYQFEEGHSFFAPAVSVALPVFNHNEGPIAEAEAQRKIAAANLISVQAGVLGQSEHALSQYAADYRLSAAAQAVVESWKDKEAPIAQRTVAAGEADWSALNAVQLQSSVAEKSWVDSIFQAQSALGQVENALQKPLEAGDDVPMVLPK